MSETEIKLGYIGACALLGRFSQRFCDALDEDDLWLVQRALEDCAKAYPTLTVWTTEGRGSSLEIAAPLQFEVKED